MFALSSSHWVRAKISKPVLRGIAYLGMQIVGSRTVKFHLTHEFMDEHEDPCVLQPESVSLFKRRMQVQDGFTAAATHV